MAKYTPIQHRTLENFVFEIDLRRGSRGSQEFLSARLKTIIDKLISTIISMIVVNIIGFEASFVTLFKDKVSKNAPKTEIV